LFRGKGFSLRIEKSFDWGGQSVLNTKKEETGVGYQVNGRWDIGILPGGWHVEKARLQFLEGGSARQL